MFQLNECAQPPCQCLPLQTSEMGDTNVHFIRSMPPTSRSELTELQNLLKNSAAGLSRKHSQRELTVFEQRVIDNATDEWRKRL